MSEKTTLITAGEVGGPSLLLHGWQGRGKAIIEIRRHFQAQAAEAAKALRAIEAGEVHVYHQRGVYVTRNRREVL